MKSRYGSISCQKTYLFLGMCKSHIFVTELRKNLDHNMTVDFSIQNFVNFQITNFALNSSMQITHSIRNVMAGNTSTDQSRRKLSTLQCIVKNWLELQIVFTVNILVKIKKTLVLILILEIFMNSHLGLQKSF